MQSGLEVAFLDQNFQIGISVWAQSSWQVPSERMIMKPGLMLVPGITNC